MICYRCDRPTREIQTETAASLYEKLKPYLRVVPSFGCYTPTRGRAKAGNHQSWPLHTWKGPGHFPLVVKWEPSGTGRHPTFGEFAAVYGFRLVETAPLPQSK